MRVAFFIYDYVPANLPLQPWLTIWQAAVYLSAQGHDVHVVTDTGNEREVNGLPVHRVASLRGSNNAEVRKLLQAIRPECVVVLVTPLNLATTGWYQQLRKLRGVAFASYPFYSVGQITTALRHVEPGVLSSYARHLLVPGWSWRKTLSGCFKAVICQSDTTRRHLYAIIKDSLPVHAIKPGIDRQAWHMPGNERTAHDYSEFLYVGRASRIRGFHVALDAMTRLQGQDIRLKVLARGADEYALAEIDKQVKKRGLGDLVRVTGGWLEQPQLVSEFHATTAVLLPFVLVPSELPVSAMEAIACGAPVISTDIDGLPSTVADAGIVVRQGSASDMARAMLKLHTDRGHLADCRNACRRQTELMPSWMEMGRCWEEVLTRG